MPFTLQRYSKQELMHLLGISTDKTFQRRIIKPYSIGKPIAGKYTLEQVRNIVKNCHDLFEEPIPSDVLETILQ